MDDVEREPFLAEQVREVAPDYEKIVPEKRHSRRGNWPSFILTILLHILVSASLTTFMFFSPMFLGWELKNKASENNDEQNSIALIDQFTLGTEIDVPRHDLWENSIFRGDNSNLTETNEAWTWLTRWKGSRLSAEEGAMLDLTTIALPDDGRATIMSGWHNLHCINTLRQFIHKYNSIPPDEFAKKPHNHKMYLKYLHHSFHCIEVLRTSVMCQPDTNIHGLEWLSDKKNEYIIRPDVRRQCVRWDAFESWTQSRNFHGTDVWKVDEKTWEEHANAANGKGELAKLVHSKGHS